MKAPRMKSYRVIKGKQYKYQGKADTRSKIDSIADAWRKRGFAAIVTKRTDGWYDVWTREKDVGVKVTLKKMRKRDI